MMEDNNDEMILNGYEYDKINHCTQKYIIKQRAFSFYNYRPGNIWILSNYMWKMSENTLKLNKNQNAVMMDDKIKLTIIIYEMRYTIWTKHNLYSGSSCLRASPGWTATAGLAPWGWETWAPGRRTPRRREGAGRGARVDRRAAAEIK